MFSFFFSDTAIETTFVRDNSGRVEMCTERARYEKKHSPTLDNRRLSNDNKRKPTDHYYRGRCTQVSSGWNDGTPNVCAFVYTRPSVRKRTGADGLDKQRSQANSFAFPPQPSFRAYDSRASVVKGKKTVQ